jgi:UDP:flavonoid glycosyltransferase YjiC (YdhE family)
MFGTRSHAKTMLYIGEEMSKRGHKVVYMATPRTLQFAKGFNIPTIPLKIPADIQSLKSFVSNKGCFISNDPILIFLLSLPYLKVNRR